MLADNPLLTFDSMILRLQHARPFRIDQMEGLLETIQNTIHTIQAARVCGMDQRPELKTLAVIFSADAYAAKVQELIEKEIPLEDMGDGFLNPSLMGLNAWTWDDVDEACDDPTGYSNSLEVFLVYCLAGTNDANEESYQKARAHFDWPEFEAIDLGSYEHYDEKAARAYLVDHDASDLIGALEVGFFAPDNLFFSINYEDGSYEALDFTPDNLKILQDAWAEAKPVVERYGVACEAIRREPERLLTLIDAMNAGLLIQHDQNGHDFNPMLKTMRLPDCIRNDVDMNALREDLDDNL